MAKTHPLGFRVEPQLKAALERLAKEDRRSLSSLIENVLTDYATEKGVLEQNRSTID